jgi:hypothetical protein
MAKTIAVIAVIGIMLAVAVQAHPGKHLQATAEAGIAHGHHTLLCMSQ